MKEFFRLMSLLVAAAVLSVSCSKDKDSGRLVFDTPAVYLSPGQQITVGFTAQNIKSANVTGKPTGWDEPSVDFAARTVTFKAPEEFSDDVVKSGSLILSGVTSGGGSTASGTLFVSVTATVDMSSSPANSYLVSQEQTHYLFDAMHKGDGTSSLATASVDIIWQTKSSLVQYLELKDGKVSFFVDSDSDDKEKIKQGNALIGAYDAGGKLIWSWHVWCADFDPEAEGGSVDFNGYTMMNRNLGALNNANSTSAEILASFGLFYQWGRKDPFVGPSTYQASNGTAASMYNGSGTRTYMAFEASTAEVGTAEYATQHPLTYITGVKESSNDWLWSVRSDNRWAAGSKTVDDPCPAGWRIAPAAAYAGLQIKDPLDVGFENYYDKYGWTLTDGNAESLFMGAGRRVYTDGKVQNIYVNPDSERRVRNEAMYDQPWVGLYWTGDVSGSQASALYFFFNKLNVADSRIEGIVPHYRANGMPVRCVKE